MKPGDLMMVLGTDLDRTRGPTATRLRVVGHSESQPGA